MSVTVDRFTNLNTSLAGNIETAIELGTFELDFATMDVDSGILKDAADALPFWQFSQNLAAKLGHPETVACQAVYRTFFFSLYMAQLVGSHDFEITLPATTSVTVTPEASDLLGAVAARYWQANPTAEQFIDSFADELDGSDDGRYVGLVKSVAALAFSLVDKGMNDCYISEQSEQLEAAFAANPAGLTYL